MGFREICRVQRVRGGRWYWERSPMREVKSRGIVRPTHLWIVGGILATLFVAACIGLLFGTLGIGIRGTGWNHSSREEAGTLRFLIESSPNNLDLPQGTDAQSGRVG